MSDTKLTTEQKAIDKKLYKKFVITPVCRADLRNIENTTGNTRYSDEFLLSITDEQMKEIAKLMEEDYVSEHGKFFNSLEDNSDKVIFKDWHKTKVNGEMIAFKFPDGLDSLPESEYIHISNELDNDASEGELEYVGYDSKHNKPIPNFGKWILIN